MTEEDDYNIITQCDVVRKLQSQSPGEGVLSAVSDISAILLHSRSDITYFRGMTAVEQIIVDK